MPNTTKATNKPAAKRVINVKKPSKRGASPSNAPAADPVTVASVAGAKPDGTVTVRARKAPSSARLAGFHYGAAEIGDHDAEYLAFFHLAGADNGKPVDLADIARDYRDNPFYTGNASASSVNGGYISRLDRLGLATRDANKRTLSLTKAGAERARAIVAKHKLSLPPKRA